MAKYFAAELKVISVLEDYKESFFRIGLKIKPEDEESYATYEKQFDSFMADFDFSGVSYSKEIIKGTPNEVILDHIPYPLGKLLIMGTNGNSGLAKLLLGSVTEKVVREVPCSFITLKKVDVMKEP